MAGEALAVCPVCTVAVSAGLGVSRWLGIDDVITAVWIGAVVTSMGMWFAVWAAAKEWSKPLISWLLGLTFHLILFPTLYWLDIIGDPLNTLLGVDKIILGVILGSAVFFLTALFERKLKQLNNDQVIVYYQKVILPMLFLSIISFLLHLLVS